MPNHPYEREHTMTHRKSRAAGGNLKALVADDQEFLRQIVREAMQQILEAEMTDALGAEPGECTEARLGYRAGHYARTLVTRVGKLELRVPRDLRWSLLHRALRTLPTLRESAGLGAWRRSARIGLGFPMWVCS